jgi:predicted metal-dependent enzyme (double-stranded beta helix superfamily)
MSSGEIHDHRSSSLANFVAAVARNIITATSTDLLARSVRSLLSEALNSDDFVLDCIEQGIRTLEPYLPSWTNPPIVDDDTHHFSIRLVYWPPQFVNEPHEHTFWTVTGVFHNELKFMTYLGNVDGPLVVEREIEGRRGDVGYIVPPCVHSVGNHSNEPSISIHVFSGPKLVKGSYERGQTTWHGLDPKSESSKMTVFTSLETYRPGFSAQRPLREKTRYERDKDCQNWR